MMRLKFSIYGSTLCFITNSERALDEVLKDFGRFENKGICEVDGEVRFIEVDGDFPIEVPEYAIRESFFPSGKSVYIYSNERFLEDKNKYIIRASPKTNQILVYGIPTYAASPLPRYLMKWMLLKVFREKGIFFIHGSAVTMEEHSLLFVGPSGYGKTWILISLLLTGCKMITDDTILVDSNGYVLPFYMRSMIHEDTLRKFPTLRKGIGKGSTYIPDEGWLIDLSEIFPVEIERVRPSKIFSIYIWKSEKTRVERSSKGEALSRLLRSYRDEMKNSIWFGFNRDYTEKLFSTYYSLIENADCYKIFVGNNPGGFIDTVKEVLR